MSESPERRKRVQFAGKVKRLVIEKGGDRRLLEVEFGTGNIGHIGTLAPVWHQLFYPPLKMQTKWEQVGSHFQC